MKDMLKKIFAVDKKARETVEEANKERENVEKKLAEAKTQFEEKSNLAAAKKIDELKAEKKKEYDAIIAVHESECDKKIAALESLYNEKCDMWVDEIVKRALQ
ncbi:MAG: hypothetical protein PUB94_05845 [Oscillospiraceae bacterium]|nr:hypothetical protein [Oscillospiraceae bacterium]